MDGYNFPFPDRELAMKELTYDSCYGKIPEMDREPIAARAWDRGQQAADGVYAALGGEMNFTKIAETSGLSCLRCDRDYVVGNRRYFSDYITGQKQIQLYMGAIRLWAGENKLDLETSVNLILSHEYYHFLEWTRLGLASREYQVPAIQIGRVKIGKTGIRALSEIGAHGFARRYYERSGLGG